MRPLGQYLSAAGVTAYGTRLAGHGTRPEDLARSGWRDWYASALEAVRGLRSDCDRVFACGLSLGAALALLLGARGEVDGVISIAAPLRPRDRRLKYARYFAPFKAYSPKGLADLHDPAARAAHADYVRVPTRAAASLHDLTRVLARELPRVNVPLLVIHSRLDRVVPPADAQAVFDRAATPDKRLVWLERGGHIATEDYDKERVFAETLRFIQAYSR
jgi:carboxylesterase